MNFLVIGCAAPEDPKLLAQEALQRAMNQIYYERKCKNPSYSMRAFARQLDMNSGVLSSVLSGKRRLSSKKILKILSKLDLMPSEQKKIESIISMEQLINEKQNFSENILILRDDQFHMIADGIHFSILALLETKNFQSNIEWIAIRLNETPIRVSKAIDRLVRLQLLRRKKTGELLLLQASTKTGDSAPSIAVRKYHQDRLEEAKEKLNTTDIEDRDFYSTTLPINHSQLPLAKKLVRDFKKKLAKVLEKGEKDQVYRFSFQIYPVTEITKRNLQ